MQIEIEERISKNNKPYECLNVTIGEYSTLIFPSKFELMYIKKYIEKNKK